jgi:hypothetical protein
MLERPARVVAAVLLACAAAGCGAADPRPKYVAPALADADAALLKCDWRYRVTEVDGARVEEPPVQFYFAPGNTVKVEPGERKVAIAFDDGNRYEAWRFVYPFQAGRLYKVGAPGGFAKGVRLTDKSTGTSTVIH